MTSFVARQLPYVLCLAAAIVLVIAFTIRMSLRRLERGTGFRIGPDAGGRLVASDTGAISALFIRDPRAGVCGKPDYLFEETVGGRALLVPLELKPRRQSRRVYEGDELQLAAYLLALRATFGERAAPFGYVRYAASTFRVELSPSLEARVLAIGNAIRAERNASVVHRSHASPQRCARCAVRGVCDESLA